jgi:uncharacterized Zn-binding protein involved in type VI secretion
MAQVARYSHDKCNGGCGNNPELSQTHSPNVYVEGSYVLRQSDTFVAHSFILPHVGRSVASGSNTVYCNGLQLARKDDPITCGAKIATGSATVHAG